MKPLLLIACVMAHSVLNSQNWAWVADSHADSALTSYLICIDPSGNSYVAGFAHSNASFGTFSVNAGNYLLKYNSAGQVIRAQNIKFGPNKIAADANGCVYLMGNYQNSVLTETSQFTSNGSFDFYLVKLDSSGNEAWAESIGSTAYDYCKGFRVDANGNIFIDGIVNSDTLNIINQTIVDTISKGRFFLAKISTSGSTMWITRGVQEDTASFYRGIDLCLDKDNNVYALSSGSQCDDCGTEFVAKYDASGALIWNKVLNNYQGYQYWTPDAERIDIDENYNIFIAYSGYRYHSGEIIKYDPVLNTLWSFDRGYSWSCRGYYDYAVSAKGDIYLCGYLEPKVGYCWSDQYASFEILVIKVNNSGTIAWEKSTIGAGAEFAYAIAANDRFCYVTGVHNYSGPKNYNDPPWIFKQPVIFDNFTLAADNDQKRAYVAKLGTDPVTDMASHAAEQQIAVYPVPSSGIVEIKYETRGMDIRILDLSGRLAFSATVQEQANTLDLTSLEKGIYFMECKVADQKLVKKIILR